MDRPSRAPFALAAALFALLLGVAFAGGYGWFRDELYYLACSEHLAWGYVDQPPLSPALLALWRGVAGDSLPALRALPALAGALVVLLAGATAREMGGGRFAQALAALAAALAPLVLALSGVWSMNAFDLLAWALLLFLFARLGRTGDARLWPLFGLVAGLGLLNKLSVGFLLAGLAVGLLATGWRRHLRDARTWTGALVAAALFAPHVLWQVLNGWPTLEFMRNATRLKNAPVSPGAFLLGQVELVAGGVLLAVAGLAWLLADRDGRRFRPIGIAYLVVLAVFMAQGGKPYYQGPFYPALFAAGAVAIERAAAARSRRWLRVVVPVLLLGNLAALPFVVPVLPVETHVRYAAALGRTPSSEERDRPGRLDQHYADMFGWPEMAATVARVWSAIPESERRHCAIYGQNYGQAAAIDFFGRPLGLPRAISGHNSYWTWGPGDWDGRCVVIIGGDPAEHATLFRECRIEATIEHPWARSAETGLPVSVCRDLVPPVREIWPRTREFI